MNGTTQVQADAAGAHPASKGNPTIALKQERELRRQLEARVAQLEAQTQKGLKLDLSKFGITQEELETLDSTKINAKIQAAMQATIDSAMEQTRNDLAQRQATEKVAELFEQYPIFRDADQTLATDASAAASAAITGLPATATLEEIRKAVEDVVKRFEQRKAGDLAHGGEPPKGALQEVDSVLPPANGGGAAAHLNTPPARPKDMNEARRLAEKEAKGWWQRLTGQS